MLAHWCVRPGPGTKASPLVESRVPGSLAVGPGAPELVLSEWLQVPEGSVPLFLLLPRVLDLLNQ